MESLYTYSVAGLTASSAFCGNSSLSFFDPSDGAIGECFVKVFVLTPAHAALALCSAYGAGRAFAGSRVVVPDGRPRGALQFAAVALRALAVFVLLVTPGKDVGGSCTLNCLSWYAQMREIRNSNNFRP